jgi:hypothetical protein
MSPELETLDQLLGGELSISANRTLYPDTESLRRGILGLLSSGEVCLLGLDRAVIANWRWRELLSNEALASELAHSKLKDDQQRFPANPLKPELRYPTYG